MGSLSVYLMVAPYIVLFSLSLAILTAVHIQNTRFSRQSSRFASAVLFWMFLIGIPVFSFFSLHELCNASEHSTPARQKIVLHKELLADIARNQPRIDISDLRRYPDKTKIVETAKVNGYSIQKESGKVFLVRT